MLVPGLANIDAQIQRVNKAIDDCKQAVKAKEQALTLTEAEEEVANYLALAKSIQQGSVKLNAVQQNNWQKMTDKFAKTQRAMDELNTEKQKQLKRIPGFEQELAYLVEARVKSGEGIHCEITMVAGDTLVRTMVAYNGISYFRNNSESELRIKLREQGFPQERVFFDSEGGLDWRYELPEISLLP
jgi:hypothetical protein